MVVQERDEGLALGPVVRRVDAVGGLHPVRLARADRAGAECPAARRRPVRRGRWSLGSAPMSTEGGTKAVLAALGANLGIAVAKFVAWGFTGSSSMLSEAIHSVADSANQVLLLVGGRRAKRAADAQHQFGYGRTRYLYGFIVAIVLFLVGGLFSRLRGRPQDPAPRAADVAAVGVRRSLILAIVLEGFSFRTALQEANRSRGDRSLFRFVRDARQPELPVVLLEDVGALIGLVFALRRRHAAPRSPATGAGTASARSPSGLLIVIAVFLTIEMSSMLLGESALPGAGAGDPRGARGRAGDRSGHPPAHAARRPGRAARRREDRRGRHRHRRAGGARRSTPAEARGAGRRADARATSSSSPTSTGADTSALPAGSRRAPRRPAEARCRERTSTGRQYARPAQRSLQPQTRHRSLVPPVAPWTVRRSRRMPSTAVTDFKVADLSLAEVGRHQIRLAEHEMPGLMALREEYGAAQPLAGARIAGSLHMTVQTAVLIETLVALGAEVRWASCNIFSTQDEAAAAVVVGPTAPPTTRRASRSSPGRARRSRSTGGAPSRSLDLAPTARPGPNMILDDGGDATLLVHKGVEFEAAGAVPAADRRTTREEYRVILDAAARLARGRPAAVDPDRRRASRASPRRPPPASTGSTSSPSDGKLLFPAINVNDSVTKSKFDNKYGIRHSPDRRHQPGHRRADRRQGRGRLRLRRRRQGLRGVAARPGRARHRHRGRPDLRAAGGDGRLPGGNARGRRRDGRHLHHRHRQQGHHHGRAHGADEAPGDRRQHRPLRQRDRHGRAGPTSRASTKIEIKPQVHEWRFAADGAASIIVLSEGRLLNLGNATGHP